MFKLLVYILPRTSFPFATSCTLSFCIWVLSLSSCLCFTSFCVHGVQLLWNLKGDSLKSTNSSRGLSSPDIYIPCVYLKKIQVEACSPEIQGYGSPLFTALRNTIISGSLWLRLPLNIHKDIFLYLSKTGPAENHCSSGSQPHIWMLFLKCISKPLLICHSVLCFQQILWSLKFSMRCKSYECEANSSSLKMVLSTCSPWPGAVCSRHTKIIPVDQPANPD